MNMDAVIGCDAVDAGTEWLRLRTAGGAVRTLPWGAVKIAGLGGNHEGHVEIQGVTERVAPFFATHESLWIVYAEGGFAQAMIEKEGPAREAILATFAQRLGIGWRGEELTTSELTDALFAMPVAAPLKVPRVLIFMIAGMLFVLLSAVVVLVLGRSH